MSDITALYCVTPDTRFRSMAASSIYTLLGHNPGTPIRVTEAEGGDYPIGIKHHALREAAGNVSTPWALFIDADTHVHGVLADLIPSPKNPAELCARRETMWKLGRIGHNAWWDICAKAGVPSVSVYNSGLFLLRSELVVQVAGTWAHWINWLPKNVEDPLCPREARKRYPWWMLEQCALSLAVASLPRHAWGRHEHSYQWNKEKPGIVHHYGSKRWKDIL